MGVSHSQYDTQTHRGAEIILFVLCASVRRCVVGGNADTKRQSPTVLSLTLYGVG